MISVNSTFPLALERQSRSTIIGGQQEILILLGLLQRFSVRGL
jgi:hypothetical protein